jgi:methyl-accepting chemotaxis protein
MDELEARVARLNKIISRLGNPIDGGVATNRFLIEYAKLLSEMGIVASDLPIGRHNTVVKSRYRPELLAFARKQHLRMQKLRKRKQELLNGNSDQEVSDFKNMAAKVLKQIMEAIESGTEATDLVLIEFAITDKELREKIAAQNQVIERLMREVTEITEKQEAVAGMAAATTEARPAQTVATSHAAHRRPKQSQQQQITGGMLLGRYSRRRLNMFSDKLAVILEPFQRECGC